MSCSDVSKEIWNPPICTDRYFNEGTVTLMKAWLHTFSELTQHVLLPDNKLQENFVEIFFIQGHWAISYLYLLGKDRALVIKF